jgi:hypothetical protein
MARKLTQQNIEFGAISQIRKLLYWKPIEGIFNGVYWQFDVEVVRPIGSKKVLHT